MQSRLPGYKKVNPMVYCGLYPADGAKYPDLRDALEKLQLNDASLSSLNRKHLWRWALVSAVDFLGLLHLEIIQERLEREYNLDLVTTAPGVIYKVHKTNGEMIELTNPSNLPDPSEIDYHGRTDCHSAEIMVTTELYRADHGACVRSAVACIRVWNIWKRPRALLNYELPLNEIIYDFFDALKSRSTRICIL